VKSLTRETAAAGRKTAQRSACETRARRFPGLALGALAIASFLVAIAFAQEKPRWIFEEDVQAFAVAQDNKIVCAVPHVKRVKKIIIERDDVWVLEPNGGRKRIIEGNKFMPSPPPSTYVVDTLAWSPNGHRIAMSMNIQNFSTDDSSEANGGKQVALLEEDGAETKVAGSKTRFIEDNWDATWLVDKATGVY